MSTTNFAWPGEISVLEFPFIKKEPKLVDLIGSCVIMNPRCNRGQLKNEKESKNTDEYRRKTQAWFSQQDGHEDRPPRPETPPAQRKKTHRFLMLKGLALNLIKGYQACVRIYMPQSCRFTPSCSEYAYQAIARYGFLKGCIKAGRRLLCCHPFSQKSGYDPLA